MSIKDLQTHPEKKVNAVDLSEYWGVGEATVYRLAANGALPCARVGRRVIFDRDEMLRFERESGRPEREDGHG